MVSEMISTGSEGDGSTKPHYLSYVPHWHTLMAKISIINMRTPLISYSILPTSRKTAFSLDHQERSDCV